jgi:hypothetical protein
MSRFNAHTTDKRNTRMQLIRAWLRCQKAVAYIEFAFVAPFLFMLVLGGVEVTRYALILARLDKATYDMANIIAQEIPATNPPTTNEISVARVEDALSNMSRLITPYDASERQIATVTSLQRVGGQTLVQWRIDGGGSFAGAPSMIAGEIGANAGFTGPRATDIDAQLITMIEGENMLVIETAYAYEPLLEPVLDAFGLEFAARTFRREHFFAPRLGLLLHLPPLVPVP